MILFHRVLMFWFLFFQCEYLRGYDANERYDSRWKKVRNIYIKAHPLCEECIKENRFIKATVVHHKLPIENGGDKYDLSNLESLCQSHHMSIHKNLEKVNYKFWWPLGESLSWNEKNLRIAAWSDISKLLFKGRDRARNIEFMGKSQNLFKQT